MSQRGDPDHSNGGTQPGRAMPSHMGEPGRPRLSTRARVFRWIAAGLAVILVLACLTAYLKFRSVWDSITRVNVANLGPAPRKFTNAMNVLVIGSDTRAGANQRFGRHVTGQRSDTIIILHISRNGHAVVVLSIPRDSVVPVMACPPADGSPGQAPQPGRVEQINATFAAGGPGCLWETVEQTTHIHLDHFIQLDFIGFEKVIDDIGGVSICLPFAIHDPRSQLNLSRGRHHVYGREALAFWRARYIGEGSDLQRIRRDQYLMASVLQAARHRDFVGSPSRLVSVITDAAKNMTTDAGLNLQTMITIVDSLRHLPPGAVQFVELPTVPYPANTNWVQWPAADRAIFNDLAHDLTVQRPAKPESRGQALVEAATASVSVRVINGSGVAGVANAAASELTAKGVTVALTGTARSHAYQTSWVEYASAANRNAATTIAGVLGGAQLKLDPTLRPADIRVVVGSDFASKHHAASASPSASPTQSGTSRSATPKKTLTGQYGGITGSAKQCRANSAFAGPNGGS